MDTLARGKCANFSTIALNPAYGKNIGLPEIKKGLLSVFVKFKFREKELIPEYYKDFYVNL